MIMDSLVNYIKDYWHIATVKTPLYEYVIELIELCEKDKQFSSLIHYRAIGARTVAQASASDLNHSNIFVKFPPAQAQAIVTLATLETIQKSGTDKLRDQYLGYIQKCAKMFIHQSKK